MAAVRTRGLALASCARARIGRGRALELAPLAVGMAFGVLLTTTPYAHATNFQTDQNAALQLGSSSFTSYNRGPNMARGLDRPYGVQLDASGRVLVGDFGNNRLAVFNSLPTANGASVDYAVRNYGTADYRGGCSAAMGRHVSGGWSGGGRLAVVESVETSSSGWNSRVMLYDSMPTSSGATATRVLGQSSFTSCGAGAVSASTLSRPSAVWTDGTRIIVSDRDNHRVLIWNSWPTTDGKAADLVLGQPNMTSNASDDGLESASTLEHPNGVWSDGTKIVVADTFNNRVLVWNAWPTTNGQAASLVIGQDLFTTTYSGCSASQGWAPKGVASNGTRLAITDGRSRVLLYDSFPTASGAAADRVVGQASPTTCAGRNAGATTALGRSSLAQPYGVSTNGTRLLVADRLNHRVLVWNAWPTTNDAPADVVIGHQTFSAAGANDVGLHNVFRSGYYSNAYGSWSEDPLELSNGGAWPAVTPGGELWISDAATSRLDRFGGWPTSQDQAPTMRFGQHSDDQGFCNGTDDAIRAETLCYPMGTWTDGTRLAIADTANHRVKLWNSMPTVRNQPPDVVVGQASWTTRSSGAGAAGMTGPTGVTSDGTRLVVTDTGNHRVLVWSTWPTTNGQAADVVLGQADFTGTTANAGGRSARSLSSPLGVSLAGGKLAVSDQNNHRILVWNTFPTLSQQPADALYGQTSFTDASTTSLMYPKGVAISDNALFFTARCDAQSLDPIPSAIVASGATRIGRGCSSSWPSQNNVWVPTGIAAHRGSVWISNDGNARMMRFDDITDPTIVKGPAHSVRSGCGSLVRVAWSTSESGTSELYWGPSSSSTISGYTNQDIQPGITGLLHERTLSGVAAGTYYYRVRTVDAAGNAVVSGERAFTVDGSAPPNDLFSGATVFGNAGGTFTGTNMGACVEAGEPDHAGVTGGSSVWYEWTAVATGRYVVDTLGSDFDTTLAVYTGTSVSALTAVAGNDDASTTVRQSRTAFDATAGVTYRIAVDGWQGDSGALQVTLRAVLNDAFADAQAMSGTKDIASGSTVGATKETGEPNHAGNAGGASIWYTWTAPTTGTVTIDTIGSSFDTLLAAYTGTSVGALTLVASNDDTPETPGGASRISFDAVMGTTYRFAVDGWNGTTGDVTISLVQPPTLTGASPSSGPQGRRSLVVALTGTAFTSSTTVSFSGSGITPTATTYISPTRIDVTIDIASTAATGARDVTVSNPNGFTATGLFSVTTPSISVSLSTLGYVDTARDETAPFDLSFGLLDPGTVREIGTTGSGQALAGPAVRATISSDTHTQLGVSSTTWSSTAGSLPAGAMAWKHNGVAEPWTPMTETQATTDSLVPPGTSAVEHDLRLTLPADQAAGSYSTSVSYTVVVAP